MGRIMNFNDFIIDQEDYDFFQSLPKDEKLLFIYDLICEEAFGSGSVVIESGASIKPIINDFAFELENFKDHLTKIVEKSINPEAKVNVLVVNDKIILNSNSEIFLNDAIHDMFMDGCIMVTYKMSDSTLQIFKKLSYCKAFILAGRNNPIQEN
jgi:hypothetical protein